MRNRDNGETSSIRDRMRKRIEERRTGQSWTVIVPEGITKFKPKKGTMRLDIVPYEVTVDNHPEAKKGELWCRRTFYVHANVGVGDDGQGGKTRICLSKTFGKACPICETRAGLVESGGDKKLIDSLKPKIRDLYNVIDLDDEDSGIQVWDVSYHLFTKQLEKELREGEEDLAGFAELKGGYTIKARFDMKTIGKGDPFPEADRIDFEKRPDYKEGVLSKVIDLDKTLNELSYKQLKDEFLGTDEDSITQDSEESKVSSTRTRASSLREESNKGEGVEESSKVVGTLRERTRVSRESAAPVCPAFAKGGVFGKDCESLDECAICPEELWSKCGDEYDRTTKKSK